MHHSMHQIAKKCCIVFVTLQVEHAGQKRPKYNVGEPISLYGMEWCSLCKNPYVDDIVFSYQTSYVRLRPHRQTVRNGPPPSFQNMVVKLAALTLSAIDV